MSMKYFLQMIHNEKFTTEIVYSGAAARIWTTNIHGATNSLALLQI